MTDKELILDTLRRMGKTVAQGVQAKSADMTGTELNGEGEYIPSFLAACKTKNMKDRSAGFVCKSSAGRVVSLLQPYDSTVYTQEPEDLAAQWRFVWSTDPAHAKPFVALATSPYKTGDCCTYGGHVWRSGQDNNTWPPGTPNIQWEDLGPIMEVI